MVFSLKTLATANLTTQDLEYLKTVPHIPLASEVEICNLRGGCKDSITAIKKGHLDCLKGMREHCDTRTSNCAAWYGHLNVLKWLRSEGVPCNESTCAEAIRMGHLDCLKWLREGGVPLKVWGESGACAVAAGGRNMDVLKWLRSEGGGVVPWDEWACAGAAECGQLDVLKWLRSEGAPWDWWSCAKAAAWGHLDCLMWMKEQGGPFDPHVARGSASIGEHVNVLDWLKESNII